MDILLLLRDIGVFGLAMWFIQLVISKSADRKFESYKTELDHKTREFQTTLDTKVELFKAELNIQNYKTTKVYEQQLDVIVNLHKRLVNMNDRMKEMTAIFKSVRENFDDEEIDRINRAGDAYNEFFKYFQENSIFLPTKTEKILSKIRNDYFEAHIDYTFINDLKRSGSTADISLEESKAAYDKINTKIPPALSELKENFRELIGVYTNLENPKLTSKKQT